MIALAEWTPQGVTARATQASWLRGIAMAQLARPAGLAGIVATPLETRIQQRVNAAPAGQPVSIRLTLAEWEEVQNWYS